MIRAGSQNARLLDVLRRGPATNAEIHDAAGHMIVNSRVAELRAHGYEIECEHVEGEVGAHAYRYTLLHDPTQRAEATTTPEGAKGWVDQAGSAQVLAGGHGLDVAPDASPGGSEQRPVSESTTAGASRATPPMPLQLTLEVAA